MKARESMRSGIKHAGNFSDFKKLIDGRKIALARWCGYSECEEKVKEATAATIRCIEKGAKEGKCVVCGKPAKAVAYFAKAY